MNKSQQKMMQYGTAVNQLIEATEQGQELMGPLFTPLKEAVIQQKVTEMPEQEYQKTRQIFETGVASYHDAFNQFKTVAVPARLMGNHHLLTKAYASFIEGCEDLIATMTADQKIDEQAFLAAETKQDETTAQFSKLVSKISLLA